MKTVEKFAQHNRVWLKAVQQDDTQVATLSQCLVIGKCALFEVWFLPEKEMALSDTFLNEAGFHDAKHLLHFYQVERSQMPVHAYGRRCELVSQFANHLDILNTGFHLSLVQTVCGPVISAVFGSRQAMRIMYEHGLRDKPTKEVDEEASA